MGTRADRSRVGDGLSRLEMSESTAWFMEPMLGWSLRKQLRTVLLFAAVVFPVAAWLGLRIGEIFIQPDAEHYLAMADGRPVMMPFASRQLGPLIAHVMSWGLHLGTAQAFEVQGVLALLFFIVAIAWLLVRSGAPRWTLYLIGGLMFWGFQFNALVMPDLLYAALLCCFLLLLHQKHTMAARLMMFPLMLSRESTLLTLVCFLVAGLRRLKLREMAVALVSAGVAMAIVKRLTLDALPNSERISPMLYLVAKMPWNFLRNVLGIGMWANLYPSCAEPKWQLALHLGPLRAIGFCGFFPGTVAKTFGLGMATFGLLPVLVWRVRRLALRTGRHEDMMLRFAALYGALSFLLAPSLGDSVLRLFGYGWPLFLVALPLLLGASGADFTSTWAAAAFLALHLFLAWYLLGLMPGSLFTTALAFWILGWLLLRWTFLVETPHPTGCGGVIGLSDEAS